MNPLMLALMSIVLPMDPASQALVSAMAQDPKFSSIYNAAQMHPKTVEVRQEPSLAAQGLQGQWRMNGGNDQIGLGNPRAGKDTMAHELTHFLLGNSQFNQSMPPAKQEYVSQSFGDHGSRIPELYKGQELEQIYRALIGQ
jgi:hypothetical protein